MDDKTRETVLDPTFLQPGVVARGGALALAAVGIGAGVLLACWGASMFFNSSSKRLDALIAKVEELVQRSDRTDEVVAKLDDLRREAGKMGGGITARLAAIEGSIEEIKHRPIIPGNPGNHEKTNGNVIEREVTVFHTVSHDNGSAVWTGWQYADGASADQPPKNQFCYWGSERLGGTTATARIDLAHNGKRLQNIGAGVPQLENALQKCIWWTSFPQPSAPAPNQPELKPNDPPAAPVQRMMQLSASENLNLRAAPDPTSDKLLAPPNDFIPKDRIVEPRFKDLSTDCRRVDVPGAVHRIWCPVFYGDAAGWVNALYLNTPNGPLSCSIDPTSFNCSGGDGAPPRPATIQPPSPATWPPR
jgi:hypothetical protein